MMNSKILVFGGSGLVGSKFIQRHSQVFEIKAPSASQIDILNKDQLIKFAQDFMPDTVINFAAYTQVENAEAQKGDKSGICYQINAIGAKNVALVCKQLNRKLIHISTEYVFDGTKESNPYTEEDEPNPINWYGQTKYVGEQLVFESGCNVIVARICMPFSPFYEPKKDVARFFLGELQNSKSMQAIGDQKVTPTYVNYIINALRKLAESKASGIYHISSTDSVTPFEFAKNIAEIFKLDSSLISSISLDEYNKSKVAKLLKYSWLNPTKFKGQFGEGILDTVTEGLKLFKKEIDGLAVNQL